MSDSEEYESSDSDKSQDTKPVARRATTASARRAKSASTDDTTTTTADPPKRKPGRPRKRDPKPPPKRLGVLAQPTSDDYIVELRYDEPITFKKIYSYWKSLEAGAVKFVFAPDGLTMYTRNFKGTNDVGIKCNGARMNHYYCQPEGVEINVLFTNLELVLQNIDRCNESITFVIRKKTQHKLLHVIFDNEVNIRETYDIEIILDHTSERKDSEINTAIFDVAKTDYPLEFRLSGKYFKKTISDIKQFNKQWTIEKFREAGKLKFTYKTENGQVKAKAVPLNEKDVMTRCDLDPREIFSVSVFADSIKPTASSVLAETLTILAAKDKRLWVHAEIDDSAIVINVFIKIVDYTSV